MSRANPKYILRNWMAAEAYEAAERGDFGPVREVHQLLCNPYEEQVAFMDNNGHLILVSENGDAVDLGPDPTGRKWMELGLNDR